MESFLLETQTKVAKQNFPAGLPKTVMSFVLNHE
jgi:hypothetical protein